MSKIPKKHIQHNLPATPVVTTISVTPIKLSFREKKAIFFEIFSLLMCLG